MRDSGLDFEMVLPDVLVSLCDVDPDFLGLILNIVAFLVLVLILSSQDVQLAVETGYDVLLAEKLRVEVGPQLIHAIVLSLSSSLQVLDLSEQAGEVAVVELVRLDFILVSLDDPISDPCP